MGTDTVHVAQSNSPKVPKDTQSTDPSQGRSCWSLWARQAMVFWGEVRS